nr:ATP-binding protein [Bacteroides sp.]
MLLNLTIKNYRSFRDETIFTTVTGQSKAKPDNITTVETIGEGKCSALRISLIFGANAAGKSNLIKFMDGLVRWVNNTTDDRDRIALYDPFLFDADTPTEPVEFNLEFLCNRVRYVYSGSFNGTSVEKETLESYPKGKRVMLFERKIDSSGTHTANIGTSLAKERIPGFEVFPGKLIMSKFLHDIPSEQLTEVASYLSGIIISNGFHEDISRGIDNEVCRSLIEDPERLKLLATFLNRSDTGISDIKIEKNNGRYEAWAIHETTDDDGSVRKVSLPMREESFGTRSLFLLGFRLLQSLKSGRPMLADEIDSGLHSHITEYIVSLYRDPSVNTHNSQIVFTTHDNNLLDQTVLRRDQVWFVEKDELGRSTLYSLSDFSDVRENTPFARWYMNNKFGGVPSIGSNEYLYD